MHKDSNESLDRMVLKFLGSAQDMEIIADELIDIMQDGIIDEKERKRVESILETLDSIAAIISEIKKKMEVTR